MIIDMMKGNTMDKNEKVQQNLDEEQLQQVTGSGVAKPNFGRSMPIDRPIASTSAVDRHDRNPSDYLTKRFNERLQVLDNSGYNPLSDPKPMTEAERTRQNDKIVKLATLYKHYNPK
jgi:hypothetical protein